jgi:DNA repair exonuclease SbcCD ATPase subunit/DNA repair exonuclease SbcCD nuclease subunit
MIKKIDKIYHIADVHIRNFKRHKEYNEVFARLIEYIDRTKTESSVIYLAGDIVHNKIDMTPELIEVTSNFLKMCADTLPTILIAGNHDLNLNSNRLDALSPIVDSLNRYYSLSDKEGIYYWKESGTYELGGISFGVCAVTNDPDKWPVPKKDASLNVALHHGAILNSQTDISTIMSGHPLSVFDGYDMALLGDIHKFQFLNSSKTIAYAGSLIQQDFGESLSGHGLIVWNLSDLSHEFVPIKNDYGYHTFDIIDNHCEIPHNLPANLRARIRFENTDNSYIESFIKSVSERCTIIELTRQRSKSSSTAIVDNKFLLADSRDVSNQNRLISEFLSSSSDCSPAEVGEVLKLNTELNKLLPVRKSHRNVVWKPLNLYFSNMFSYGENNFIDFLNMSGTYGIWAGNAQGKSSILDILSFVIFDKSTRANKASHIMNNEKNIFKCRIDLELKGGIYTIERVGIRKPDGNVKVDVNFFTIDSDGNTVNLNGEDRDKTNFIIREYFGTYDDFVMTALSTQYDNQNFVEKTQKDRKDLLYKFLDILVYDELFNTAKASAKEHQVIIRELEKEQLHTNSSRIYSEMSMLETEADKVEEKIHNIKSDLKVLNNNLQNLNKDYHNVKEELSIESITGEIAKTTALLNQSYNDIKSLTSEKETLEGSISAITARIDGLKEYSDYTSIVNKNSTLLKVKTDIQSELIKLDSIIAECQKKQSHLESHEYDPNCVYCTNNQFVKDAKQAISILPSLIVERDTMLHNYNNAEADLIEHKKVLEIAEEYNTLLKKMKQMENDLKLLVSNIDKEKYKGKSFSDSLKVLNKRKEQYNADQIAIENNKKITEEIRIIKEKISKLDKEEVEARKVQTSINAKIARAKREYEECSEKLKKYLDNVNKFRIYELYMQATSKEGVPYKIVEQSLPILESEVNNILSQIVNFTTKIEAVDDKYINADIVYNQNKSWPIELTSGMERFVLSLAFRSALLQMTNLSKSNFLAIDEGFGVLDSENILQIGKLFEYLKYNFDFIICISHIDAMKDLTDKAIKINKLDGYSHINYAG